MKKENRAAFFDNALKIEAYQFTGIKQKFPEHFHDHYVIGAIQQGSCNFYCNRRQYTLQEQEVLLLNPLDNHSCTPSEQQPFIYCALTISKEIMQQLVWEITETKYLPVFSQPAVKNNTLACAIEQVYLMIAEQDSSLKKEENLFFLLEQLLREHSQKALAVSQDKLRAEIIQACSFLENNFAQNITLAQLTQLTGLSKYHLLRSFVKEKGITPYRYLENIRINKAKELLQQQLAPNQVAIQTGFADQSHFSNFFKSFIGLTPKQYLNIFKEKTN